MSMLYILCVCSIPTSASSSSPADVVLWCLSLQSCNGVWQRLCVGRWWTDCLHPKGCIRPSLIFSLLWIGHAALPSIKISIDLSLEKPSSRTYGLNPHPVITLLHCCVDALLQCLMTDFTSGHLHCHCPDSIWPVLHIIKHSFCIVISIVHP